MVPDPRLEPEVLLAHKRFVRALARSLIADKHQADDVEQETWVQALERPPRDALALRAWLGVVARSLAGKWLRGEARRRAREHAAARSEAVASPAEIVEQLQIQRRVVDAVLALREPYRSAICLRYYEELPPRRIAERLEVPVETVKARLKRGLAQLRERLDQESDGNRSAWSVVLARVLEPPHAGFEVGTPRLEASTIPIAGAAVLVVGFALSWWWHLDRAPESSATAQSSTASRADSGASGPSAGSDDASTGDPAAALRARRDVEVATASSGSESTAPESPRRSALTVRTTWGEHGPPAPGIRVRLIPWSVANPLLNVVRGVTDENGSLSWTSLPPGRTALHLDRGGGGTIELVAGAANDLVLPVSAGLDLTGIVVDGEGRPIPEADVWLSEPLDPAEGTIVTTTGMDGTFALRSVASHCWIGARARERAPTRLRQVTGRPGNSLDVRLEMSEPGGALSVRVRGPTGEGVPGALLFLSSGPAGKPRPEAGVLMARAPSLVIRGDAEGECLVEGLVPGPLEVVARAHGLAPAARRLEIRPGVVEPIEISLPAGVTLKGRVTTSAGEPAAGAELGVGVSHPFFALTSVKNSFTSSLVRAGADGEYELPGLAAGEIRVWVRRDGSSRSTAVLHAPPGASLDWNPVLPPASAIEGRLVDERGDPLAGWFLHAAPEDGDESSEDGEDDDNEMCGHELPRSDLDGCFRLDRDSNGSCTITVREPKTSRICLRVEGVRSGGAAIVLEMKDAALPSAFVTGTLRLPSGEPAKRADLYLFQEDESTLPKHVDPETGRFRFGPLPPGDYDLLVDAEGFASLRSPSIPLTAGETRDVGAIALQNPGALRVLLSPSSLLQDSLTVQLFDPDTGACEPLHRGEGSRNRGTFESGPVTPGRKMLQVFGPDVVGTVREVEVTSNALSSVDVVDATVVTITLEPGLAREVHARAPASLHLPRRLPLTLFDSSELPLATLERTPATSGHEWRALLALAPGRYTLRARTSDGRRLEAPLEVEAGDAPLPTVVLLVP